MAQRTDEQRAKHAEYMLQYYADHPGYKAEQDAKYRRRYIEKLRSRDKWRRMKPEVKAQRLAQQRKRYAEKTDEIKAYQRAYYVANKDKWIAKNEKIKQLPPEEKSKRSRKYCIKHAHGLTMEQYESMLESQQGVCAICKTPPTVGHNKRLHVDHDHVTGAIRGLLCMFCNHAMERIDHVPNWAKLAEQYVSRPYR